MATLCTKPITREVPTELTARAAATGRSFPPYLFTFSPEGLSARVKGARQTHGPISWDRVFAWLVSRELRDQLRDDARLAAIADSNPTFDTARASDALISAEMAVGGSDD